MKTSELTQGTVVRLDSDNEQWGRVCGLGTVMEAPSGGWLTVAADEIRADIRVRQSEVFPVSS